MDDNLYRDIPKEFYSASTGIPFDRCIECDKYLLEENTEYLIEKAIKNYPGYKAQDTLFDYAICMDCAQAMHGKMSKESLENIQLYFTENVDLKERSNKSQTEDLSTLTQKCMIKDTLRNESTEFQLYAHCVGGKVFMGNPPYLISGEAMEEVMTVLSKATKDELGGFFDKHFSPDPDFFESDPKRRLILI
ncbi:MAG: hypothetical protein ACJA08_001204 [Cyclobacteriaceae bacterium]|jgi:hypothetical protein